LASFYTSIISSLRRLTPTNNTVWVAFENNMGKKVEIYAYELWGYTESRYLSTTKVELID